MPREISYTAIILKKQPLNEADEIITFFSREAGKMRGLAKSVKLAKSKLQNNLQALFLADLALAGGGHLPKIIGAQALETFPALRQNLDLAKRGFYAVELVLKFTPDGQKNEKLFVLLLDFLKFLNNFENSLDAGLAKFKAEFLAQAGLAATAHHTLEKRTEQLELCRDLESCAFGDLESRSWGDVSALQKFLSDFIVYHLEREVKSERFLDSVV